MSTENTSGQSGPLSGITVIDISRALAGPHAAMMLGDLGARIIKIEMPETGDDTRSWGPPFVGEEPESTYFLSCNRNKESLTLNLKSASDRDILLGLIAEADVLVENFRPGVLERLQLGVPTLHHANPQLVILSLTGFGHDGPEADRAGYDQIAQGEAGLMSLTGEDPEHVQRVGVPIADLLSGIYGAFGAVSALLQARSDGKGRVVRTSLLAALVGVHAFQGTRYTVAGQVPEAQGNHHPSIAPYGLFQCRDGAVQISVGSQKLWSTFATRFGLDANSPRYQDNAQRVGNRAELVAEIEAAFSQYTMAALLEILDTLGIPAGRVRTMDQVYQWEQLLSQGLLIEVDHSSLGPIKLPGPPLRFFSQFDTMEETFTEHLAPPRLNEHSAELQSWIEDLRP